MANTARTRAVELAIADAQRINPRNLDDAYYILAHKADFDSATIEAARRTEDAELQAYYSEREIATSRRLDNLGVAH